MKRLGRKRGQTLKRRDPGKPSSQSDASPGDARSIDERYGLEPVYEPADSAVSGGGRAGTQAQSIRCPYCGERFETVLDLSAGSASYIEDCQVCCRPIELNVEVDDEGELVGVSALRGD